MPNTLFRICKASSVGEPAEPPFDAWPLVEAAPVVTYPEPKSRNGLGYPARVLGLPFSNFGRDIIGVEGVDYYNDLFESTSSGSALVKVNLYDPRSVQWRVYQGVLWRPTIATAARSGTRFNQFRIAVTELTPSSWS